MRGKASATLFGCRVIDRSLRCLADDISDQHSGVSEAARAGVHYIGRQAPSTKKRSGKGMQSSAVMPNESVYQCLAIVLVLDHFGLEPARSAKVLRQNEGLGVLRRRLQ